MSIAGAAARSGLGAVMGSKRLKMVVARGAETIPVGDETRLREARAKHLKEINSGTGFSDFYRP